MHTRDSTGKTQTAPNYKLAGSLAGGRGGAMDISEGMIHGNDVMFKVVREFKQSADPLR
jgi:hypothetical protein